LQGSSKGWFWVVWAVVVERREERIGEEWKLLQVNLER
jgi:hypothetical protein